MNQRSNVMGAFMAGMVIGGVTALLTAPASGKVTRNKIKQRTVDVKDKTTHELDDIKNYVRVKSKRLQSTADRLRHHNETETTEN